MAPLPVIPDVFRCALNWRSGSQTAANVIHIRASFATPDPLGAFTALDASVTAQMWSGVSSAAKVESVTVTPLDGVSAGQDFATGGVAKWTGTSTGDHIPQAAIVVSEHTGIRGASHRGRVYLPFITESAQAGGGLVPGIDTALDTAWTNFTVALAAGTFQWNLVVASYKLATAADVTSISVIPLTATQRRRQSRLRI